MANVTKRKISPHWIKHLNLQGIFRHEKHTFVTMVWKTISFLDETTRVRRFRKAHLEFLMSPRITYNECV